MRTPESEHQRYLKRREAKLASSKAYTDARPDYGRTNYLRRKYGLTPEEYEEMARLCCGVCAVCGSGKDLHIDHDHSTGRVRALLCLGCNVALGQTQEDGDRLRDLAHYADYAAPGDS